MSAVVAVVGIALVVIFRRRDARSKRLEPGYAAATSALIVLDRLEGVCAINGSTAELAELRQIVSALTICEARSPEVPFGTVVAELRNYLACALPPNVGAQLAADMGLIYSYLDLVRAQGIKLEAARHAVTAVQRRIEKLTRR